LSDLPSIFCEIFWVLDTPGTENSIFCIKAVTDIKDFIESVTDK